MQRSVMITIMQQGSNNCLLAAAAASPTSIQGRWLPSPRSRQPPMSHDMVALYQRKRSKMRCSMVPTGAGGQRHRPSGEKKPSSNENPAAGFNPSIWGDFFLHYSNPTTPQQQITMKERTNILKEEVARILTSSSTSSLLQRLDLIYALERLCLDYLFKEEINILLTQISNVDVSECDLHTVALWFYLLRSHRYRVSTDVFTKFKAEGGGFTWNSPRDLLSLYNASYLSIHGEHILDEAIIFTKRHLKLVVPYLEQEGSFAREIAHALEIPVFIRVRIYEAKYYISMYEEDATVDSMILELAKLNSDLIQIQHQQELKILTRWWKDIQLQANFSFCRDRIVESYFWMAGAYFEPNFSRARIMLTMVMATGIILDDFYDSYGTPQECELFTKCIECWDRRAVDDLPENIQVICGTVMDSIEIIQHDLLPNQKYRITYLRNALVDVVKAYNEEVKWRNESYVPPTVEEHLQVSARTGGGYILSCASFVGMGDIATKESFDWVSSVPRMVNSFGTIWRLTDDLQESYKKEQTMFDVPLVTESCMKEHNVSMEVAREKLKELMERSWNDINEEWLNINSALPKVLLESIINLTRTVGFMDRRQDFLTTNYAMKDSASSLLLECYFGHI